MITITGLTLFVLAPLILCCCFCLYPLYKGPTSPDRVIAFQAFGIIVGSFCALAGVVFKRDFLMDIALCWVLLSFITILALSKYLEGRDIDE